MVTIVGSHILGAVISILFLKNVGISASSTGEKQLIIFLMFLLVAFIEYQLYRSVSAGKLYWRGTVTEKDGSRFFSCQAGYGFLAGVFIILMILNV